MNKENIHTKWLSFSSSTISDALDKYEIKGQCEGIKPIEPNYKVAGYAFTLKYVSKNSSRGNVGDFIDDVPPSSVIAIDNGGITNATVWGGILSRKAKMQNIAATVVYGVSRDSEEGIKISYPIFNMGTYMRTGKDRVVLESINEPICLSGIKVNPGDLIFGDMDGVLVIPKEFEKKVYEAAKAIEEAEQKIISEIENGSRLDDARAKHGYFNLQKTNNSGE